MSIDKWHDLREKNWLIFEQWRKSTNATTICVGESISLELEQPLLWVCRSFAEVVGDPRSMKNHPMKTSMREVQHYLVWDEL
jgi:hypothetical protein